MPVFFDDVGYSDANMDDLLEMKSGGIVRIGENDMGGGNYSRSQNAMQGLGDIAGLGQQRQMTAEEAYRQQSMVRHDQSMVQRQREAAMMMQMHQDQMNANLRMVNNQMVQPAIDRAVKTIRKYAKKSADRPIREILQDETDDWLKDAV